MVSPIVFSFVLLLVCSWWITLSFSHYLQTKMLGFAFYLLISLLKVFVKVFLFYHNFRLYDTYLDSLKLILSQFLVLQNVDTVRFFYFRQIPHLNAPTTFIIAAVSSTWKWSQRSQTNHFGISISIGNGQVSHPSVFFLASFCSIFIIWLLFPDPLFCDKTPNRSLEVSWEKTKLG